MPAARRPSSGTNAGLPLLTDRPRFDFHSHTFLTDGTTAPTDMWLHADRLGHSVLAITDHVSLDDPRPLLRRLASEARAFEDGPIDPPHRSGSVDGAGRTHQSGGPGRPAGGGPDRHRPRRDPGGNGSPGTNHAAIDCRDVDLLAHPGLLDPRDAELARAHGTFLEISGRRGHSLANGHVARVALEAGADLVVDSDAHAPDQLLGIEIARKIAHGAGLPVEGVRRALEDAPRRLAERCRGR